MNNFPCRVEFDLNQLELDLNQHLDELDKNECLVEFIDENYESKVDDLMADRERFIDFLIDAVAESTVLQQELYAAAIGVGTEDSRLEKDLRERFIAYVGDDYIRDVLADEFYELEGE